MKNIRTTFDSFINEELNKETYLRTADKFDELGHPERGNDLRDYVKTNKTDSAVITINGTEYEINENDVHIDDKFKTLEFYLVNTTNESDKRPITIKYNGNNVDVKGVDGIKDRKDGNILFNFIRKMIDKKVNEHPDLEDLLVKLRVNNLYR